MSAAIWRPLHGRLRVRMPFSEDNYEILREAAGAGSHRPEWDRAHRWWLAPRAQMDRLVRGLALELGVVEVFLDVAYEELCSQPCQDAKSPVWTCVCRCGGAHHRGGRAVDEYGRITIDEDRIRLTVRREDLPAATPDWA